MMGTVTWVRVQELRSAYLRASQHVAVAEEKRDNAYDAYVEARNAYNADQGG